MTSLEYDNLFSTKNLYDLPTYFNYGLGSAGLGVAGLGVFRELVTHIKTTHWVLAGAIATFPLMYHYRIMPVSEPHREVDRARLNDFIEYWGNSENVGYYMLDRANANHELILCLEYIPHVLDTWLQANPDKLQSVWHDLCRTIVFLRIKGIIHFDAHFRNILTDGAQIYVTDFGLALDKSFALSEAEVAFFEQNTFYDYGEALRNLGQLIRSVYDACPEHHKSKIMADYGIQKDLPRYELEARLLDHIEPIQADGLMSLDKFYVASIVKYRSIITLIRQFYVHMWRNKRKDTHFPHEKLRQLLKAAGLLSNTESLGS